MSALYRFLLVSGFTVRQLLSRRRSFLLLVLAMVPGAFGILVRYFGNFGNTDAFVQVVPNLYASFLVQIVSLFYGASLVRDAIEDPTAAYFLTTPLSRLAYVSSMLAGLVAVLLFVINGSILVTFAVWRAGLGDGIFGSREDLALLANLSTVISAGAIVYAAFFMLLGMITRHCAVLGILYYAVIEVGLGFAPGPARRLAISAYLDALLSPSFLTRNMMGDQLEVDAEKYAIDPGVAQVVLPLILVLLLAVILSRARRHDFVDEAATAR